MGSNRVDTSGWYMEPFRTFSNVSTPDGQALYSDYVLFLIILEIITILPTIFGNFLILLCIVKFRQLQSNMHILIGNLAVSDLLVGIVMIPLDLLLLNSDWVATKLIFCIVHRCVCYIFIGASVLNILLISIERFVAVCHPFWYQRVCRKCFIYILIGVSWIFISLLGFLPALGWRNKDIENLVCKYNGLLTAEYTKTMDIIVLFSTFFSFALLVIVARIALVKVRELPSSDPCGANYRTRKHDLKKVKIMILVSSVFAICWSPYCILSLLLAFMENDTMRILQSFLLSLGLLNSGLNWIIYGWRNKKFRAAMKLILTCSVKEGLHDSYET